MGLPRLRQGLRRLYLCRHGETSFNVQRRVQGSGVDKPLNENGQQQAKYLGKWLAANQIKATNISSSSMTRAKETAQIVRAELVQANQTAAADIATFHVDDLVEMHFGQLEGLLVDEQRSFAEVQAAWAGGDVRRRWPGAGGESPDAVAERGLRGILSTEILGSDHTHIVCICHGRFNKILLASMGICNEASRLRDASKIEQDNTCCNVLDYNPATGEFELVMLNSTEHLPAEYREAELTKRTPRPCLK